MSVLHMVGSGSKHPEGGGLFVYAKFAQGDPCFPIVDLRTDDP